jgi:hypothetical protein
VLFVEQKDTKTCVRGACIAGPLHFSLFATWVGKRDRDTETAHSIYKLKIPREPETTTESRREKKQKKKSEFAPH